MESEMCKTPKKVFLSPKMRLLNQVATPSSKKSHKFHMIPVFSGSPSGISKQKSIVNPFEHHLAERLMGHIIDSPSLFQRPATPLHSTQFEWTIDDVSSLAPANLEVCETQFQASPDSDLEEKAQAAINSYFKENVIVPSPMECHLRAQKIVFSNESTISGKGQKSVRDGICQTVLSFPPKLPEAVEKFLAPYFSFTQDQQQSSPLDCDTTIDHEARDASLRRKLFDISVAHSSDLEEPAVDIDLYSLSPPPRTPEIDLLQGDPDFIKPPKGALFISPVSNENFGAISPISKPSKLDSSLYRSTPEKAPFVDYNMSVDDWSNLSYDEVISSTMAVQNGLLRKTITPQRRTRRTGKNLSRSFSTISAEGEVIEEPKGERKEVNFYRSDSGFNDGSGEDSKYTQEMTAMDVSMRSNV